MLIYHRPKAVYYFVTGWLAYADHDFSAVKESYKSFLDQYSNLVEDAKIEFLDTYKVFVLFALGDAEIQLSKKTVKDIPEEWKGLLAKYPESKYAKFISKIIKRLGK